MPSSCNIEFDHPNNTYFSGENLNGKIRLIIKTPKTVRGVHVSIKGYAKVKWITQGNGKSRSTTYTAHVDYINLRTYITGQQNGKSFELAPGIYEQTFYCPLPLSLPTSVSGKYGDIKYEVVVTIDRPYRFDNVFTREFTVIQELNLNLYELFKIPKQAMDEKEFCCACCCFGSPETVNTKLSIPFGGYVSEQKLNFCLEVVNESARDLEDCKVKLEMCITFESTKPSVKYKYTTFNLAKKHLPRILRNSRKQFDDFLLIPLVTPSSRASGVCVRVSYTLFAIIKTGYCHKNISVQIPIVIGTTPLNENATNPYSTTNTQEAITLPILNEISNFAQVPSTSTILNTFVDNTRDNRHQGASFESYDNYAPPPLFENSMANQNSRNQISRNQQSTSTTYGWNY